MDTYKMVTSSLSASSQGYFIIFCHSRKMHDFVNLQIYSKRKRGYFSFSVLGYYKPWATATSGYDCMSYPEHSSVPGCFHWPTHEISPVIWTRRQPLGTNKYPTVMGRVSSIDTLIQNSVAVSLAALCLSQTQNRPEIALEWSLLHIDLFTSWLIR